jgi:type IV secretion system protein TrbL
LFRSKLKSPRTQCQTRRWFTVLAAVAVFVQLAGAQGFTTTNPTDIMQQFRSMRTTWMTNVWVFANQLFGILALIEFAWSAIIMALDKSDMQAWTAALVRRIMWIGAFYALLINGRNWIPAIISSFETIGQTASGTPGIAPSVVFAQGIDIAGALMDAASTSAFFTNPGSSLALAFAAILIVISYVVITLNYIVTMVESYLVISAGFIMLGFGGSRWTAPYVERYIGLAVSIGIKIVLIYCLVSAGFGLGVGWLTEAQGVGTSANPAMTAFDVMGAAIIYMMLCWQIPKLFGAVLGGSPALTGGDLAATGTAVIAGTVAVGAAGAGALAAAGAASAGAGSAAGGSAASASSAAGGTSVSGAGSAGSLVGSVGSSGNGNGFVPPPTSGPAGSTIGSNGNSQPGPPVRGETGAAAVSANVHSSRPAVPTNGVTAPDRPASGGVGSTPEALGNIGGEGLVGSGFEQERPARGFTAASHAGHSSDRAVGPTTHVRRPAPQTAESGEGDSSPTSPPESGLRASSAASDVASVQAPAENRIARTAKGLRTAHNRLREARWRLGRLSDAAPPVSPPRMPIDHDND